MKRIFALLLTISLALSCLTACQKAPGGTEPSGTPTPPVADATPTPAANPVADDTDDGDDDFAYEGDASTYYTQVYAPVLDKYRQALSEEWNLGQYLENDMSPLASYAYDGDPLENVGFAFADADGDGYCELFIGELADDEFLKDTIFALYTLKDETPVKVFSGEERARYYYYIDEAGPYVFTLEASAGASHTAWFYYTMIDGQLSVNQAIVYDAEFDSDAPWFMTYDDTWEVNEEESVDEDLAQAIIESNRTPRASLSDLDAFPFLYY